MAVPTHPGDRWHNSKTSAGGNVAAGKVLVADGSGAVEWGDASAVSGSTGGFDVTPPNTIALPAWVAPSGTGVITADPQGRISIDTGTGYKAFPGMTFLEGRLHLVYRDGTNHNSAGGVIKYRTSDDLGRTWTSATTIYTPTGSNDYRDPYVTALSSGRLVLSLHRATTGGTVAVEVLIGYSDNRGQTWSSLVAVADSFSGEVAASAPAVELPDGTILQPGYGDNGGNFFSVVWFSTDGGETFGDQVTVAADGSHDFTETTIRLLASGRLVALIRDETSGDTYRSVSTDHGATWSAESMVLDNNVAGRPDFVEFYPSALLWFGRGTSTASRWAVSWDEGATWTALQETDSGETLDSQYHAPVVLAPGYIVVPYSIENSPSDADLYVRYYFNGYGVDPLGQARHKWLEVDEQTAPATPPSGKGVFYAKTDSLPYFKSDAGTEYNLGAASGAAGGDLSGTYPNPSVVDDSHNHTSATAPGSSGDHEHMIDVFNGDASTTTFEISDEPLDPEAVFAFVGGTWTAVTVSGGMSTLVTFGSAPGSGTGNVVIQYPAAAA